MARKPSRKTIVKNLDTIFSIYIRMRRAKNDIAECVTCGKMDHWRAMQAGHFMSRKFYSTRWDDRNVEVQCMGCNVYRYGEQFKFSKHLGQDLSDELLAESRKTVKFADFELIEMIDLYKQKVEDIKKDQNKVK